MSQQCPNCQTSLLGDYCHTCGQRRIDGRLTTAEFFTDVLRRVFRFDRAFATTFLGMLRAPGDTVLAQLEGRRKGLLDPLHFFFSSVFIQFAIGAFTRYVAPLVGRDSALGWVERVGGVVALKILVILWVASIWGLLFRRIRYNMAEIYVFATYVFGTTGLLWAVVPVVDLLVPFPLGASTLVVAAVTLSIEVGYTTYAVVRFARLPWPVSFARVAVVLTVGYGALVGLVGLQETVDLMLPPMARRD
jgi:hypothetical protein